MEHVSGRRLASVATGLTGGRVPFRYAPVPWFVLEYFIPVDYPRQLKRWLSRGGKDEGFAAAVGDGDDPFAECKALHPGVLSVEEWLRARGVADMEPPPTAVERMSDALKSALERIAVR